MSNFVFAALVVVVLFMVVLAQNDLELPVQQNLILGKDPKDNIEPESDLIQSHQQIQSIQRILDLLSAPEPRGCRVKCTGCSCCDGAVGLYCGGEIGCDVGDIYQCDGNGGAPYRFGPCANKCNCPEDQEYN